MLDGDPMHRNQFFMAWLPTVAIFYSTVVGLLAVYAQRMWTSGHYQFFPLVVIAVGYLLTVRRTEIERQSQPASPIVFLMTSLPLFVLALVANFQYSGFLAIVFAVLITYALFYGMYGWDGFRAALPVLGLLLFLIPLPKLWDNSLIISLQFVASQVASILLDGTGVIHYRSGVILNTIESKYVTEEACSGIRSLFSSLAIVATACVALRHAFWRLFLNLTQTVVWVIIGNAIRVAVVVGLADNYAPILVADWAHEAFGAAVFVFILLMVWSTDAVLSSLISSELVLDAESQSDYDNDPNAPWIPQPQPMPVPSAMSATLLLLAATITIVDMRVAWVHRDDLLGFANRYLHENSIVDKDTLPQKINGFVQTSFQIEKRRPNYLLADHSSIWNYDRDGLRIAISYDTPWNEWHDLHNCYRGIGWESIPTYFINPQTDLPLVPFSTQPYSELSMQRNGQYGYVIFSAIDCLGDPVTVGQNAAAVTGETVDWRWYDRTLHSLGISDRQIKSVSAHRQPVSTIQVLVESMEPIQPEDLQDVKLAFFEARGRFVAKLRQRDNHSSNAESMPSK